MASPLKPSDLRGTGRTTRMLDAALSVAAEGKSVVVVAATEHDAERLRGILRDAPTIRVVNASAELRGMRATVFVDHYVWDSIEETHETSVAALNAEAERSAR